MRPDDNCAAGHPRTHLPSPHHPCHLFEPAPGIVYLDAATHGLSPALSVDALARALRAVWVVTLASPEQHTFYGQALEEALAWRLVWLSAPELGAGPFRI